MWHCWQRSCSSCHRLSASWQSSKSVCVYACVLCLPVCGSAQCMPTLFCCLQFKTLATHGSSLVARYPCLCSSSASPLPLPLCLPPPLLPSLPSLSTTSPHCPSSLPLFSSLPPPSPTLISAANNAREAAEALAGRQAASIEGVCTELWCSPEIIRQGDMQHWSPGGGAGGQWLDCHFVLTRAGFLYWFRSMEDTHPLDSLCLARCVGWVDSLCPALWPGVWGG